jgi:xanthine/uracil permease
VIARSWVYSEQPLPLRLAALPLHPFALLLALALGARWMLGGRVSAARLVFLAVGASVALLTASTLLFAGVGTALYALPTYALGFAPWWWGLGGAFLISAAVRYVRKLGLDVVRERPCYARAGDG